MTVKLVVRATAPILLAGLALLVATPARAQVTPCSAVEPTPPKLPPAGSPTLYRCAQVMAHPVDETLIDRDSYRYYLKAPRSLMSQSQWVPYNEDAVLADGQGLWKTGFLDNFWIETLEEPYDNGVMGIHVIFHIEERPRLKFVDYVGSRKVEISKIEDTLKDRNIHLQIDQFIDMQVVRRVEGIVKELYGEQGYQAAEVIPELTPIETGSKLVRLTFNIKEGPQLKIKQVVFDGNKAFSDGDLTSQMKDNKPRSWFAFLGDSGTYQEAKFADDAQMVAEFYQNRGYVAARIGTMQLEELGDSKDGKTRYIRLRIPVDEGHPYRLGKFEIKGNTAVRAEAIRAIFKMKEGELVSRKQIMKGRDEVRSVYGRFGYYEVDAYPDFCFRGTDCDTGKPLGPEPLPDIVDITLQVREGKQYYVHRIEFAGNTTTHDNVIRREVRLVENYVFNTEALKESVKRLNQLGYFKPIERAEDMEVTPTPGMPNHVDVRLHFEEQNRNQISFGAGVSQFEGFFGQLSFQTANFLGRGETVGISLQKGSQARNYQLSFSEPYLFDRPMTAGINVYARQYIFPQQYTESESGGDVMASFSMGGYRRLGVGYGYQQIHVSDVNVSYGGILADTRYSISRISPSFIYNTVNHPIFPTKGMRYTVGIGVAGLGGTAKFYSTNLESIVYRELTRRMSAGIRTQVLYSRPYGSTAELPISERVFLGGEYSIRGYDLRSVSPRDVFSGAPVGGNKGLLFNAEYYINLVGTLRFLLFYDAGQVRSSGQSFVWRDPIQKVVSPPPPLLTTETVLGLGSLIDPAVEPAHLVTTGHASAFKTSMGAELRFFMPVLNVPFRLIAAYNPQRYGVLTNNLLDAKRFSFRFAVGTTF
jgi:outer membrane protein insertion porin family